MIDEMNRNALNDACDLLQHDMTHEPAIDIINTIIEYVFQAESSPDDFFEDIIEFPPLIPLVIDLYEQEYPIHVERLKKVAMIAMAIADRLMSICKLKERQSAYPIANSYTVSVIQEAIASADGPDDFFSNMVSYPCLIPLVITLYEKRFPKQIERLKKLTLLL